MNINDIFDYLGTEFKHLDNSPKLMALYYPNYLSIENLPDHVKEVARQRLLAARAEAEARLGGEARVSSVDSILAHLDREANPSSLKDFFLFSERSDYEFKESWRKACPELEQLLLQGERAHLNG